MSPDWRRKLVRKLKRWAEQRFPVMFPVRVYLRDRGQMADHMGYMEWNDEKERAVIVLDAALDAENLIATFVEEWAHARTAHLTDEQEDADDPWHHPSFWAEYGRITKASREVDW
jgi:hypothetical protein